LTYVPRVIITDHLKRYGGPYATACPVSNSSSTAISITAPKTPPNPHVNESDGCNASSRPDTHNAFSLRMDPSPNTSDRGATGSPSLSIASRWRNNSRRGGRLRARLSPRKRRVRCRPLASVPGDRLRMR
jgi:hypothetical protein